MNEKQQLNPFYQQDIQIQNIELNVNYLRLKDFFSLRSPSMILLVVQVIMFVIPTLIAMQTSITYECLTYYMGEKYSPAIKYNYEFHRLIMPIFLHSSASHLIGNMVNQIVIGVQVQRAFGVQKFLYLYFTAGICGNIFSALVLVYAPSLGASGSICGLIGAILHLKTTRLSKIYLIINLVVGFIEFFQEFTGVDELAHAGGFFAGLFIGYTFAEQYQHSTSNIVLGNRLLWAFMLISFSALYTYDFANLDLGC